MIRKKRSKRKIRTISVRLINKIARESIKNEENKFMGKWRKKYKKNYPNK